MSSSGKTLLVIGGGIGGLQAIAALRKIDKAGSVKIILAEPKEYMEMAWASFRSPFDESCAKDSLISLEAFVKTHDVEHKKVIISKLTATEATIKTGGKIPFDVCLVATGATTKWPALGRGVPIPGTDGSIEGRLDIMKKEGDKLMSAKSVLVVGGGLIGTEVAAEIASRAKDAKMEKQVTLVHSLGHLCPEFSEEAAAMVHRKIEKLGVKVILNDKAVQRDGKWVLASSGKALGDIDEVVMTVGISPVNNFMKGMSGALSETGWVNVDEYCRVPGTDGKVFAFGDCTTVAVKSGALLSEWSPIVSGNIMATFEGKSEEEMKKAPDAVMMAVAILGPHDGVMYTPQFWTQYIIPWLKNKTMFFFKVKGELGVK